MHSHSGSPRLSTRVAGMLASALLLTAATATVSFAHDGGDAEHARAAGSSHSARGEGDGERSSHRGHGSHEGNGSEQKPQHRPTQSSGGGHTAGSGSGTGSSSHPVTTGGQRGAAKAPQATTGSSRAAVALPAPPPAAPARADLAVAANAPAPATQAGAPQAPPVGQVLAASTVSPAAAENAPRLISLAAIPGIVTRAYGIATGAGGDRTRIVLMIAWLALNGAGFLFYRWRRSPRADNFMPVSLGAHTYRSSSSQR